MQPFNENETWLICNGEIFNWKVLVVKYQLEMRTNCDCEVIIRLYNKFIIDYDGDVVEVGNQLCNVLDGEFAFVIYDDTIDKVLAARDSYGVRPLFFGKTNDSFNTYMYCSEMKGIHNLCQNIEQFRPGCFMIDGCEYIQYTNLNDIKINPENEAYFLKEINKLFEKPLRKDLCLIEKSVVYCLEVLIVV